MNRGDIVIGAERGDFAGKPRPFVVVQAQRMLRDPVTVTVCPVTTRIIGIGRIRVALAATPETGLEEVSEIEVDRITTIRRIRSREIVGRAPATAMRAIDRSLREWLEI